jgi:dihydroorotate dehydrogenase
MYRWLRQGLFQLEPERAHDLALAGMHISAKLGLLKTLFPPPADRPVELMGLRFKNPVGLAAGLDKNGDHIETMAALGFGFIEVGTVTPRPQPGNDKPRLFRLTNHDALINRMGFNNKGVDHLVENLKTAQFDGIIGANVGKQKDTPLERAADDYCYSIRKVYPHCDYIAVNISSPNTAGLRELQHHSHLKTLLSALVQVRDELAQTHGKHRPVLIKIAPDWAADALVEALELMAASGIDGLIATNTTIERDSVGSDRHASQAGGLSGPPLTALANQTLSVARRVVGDQFPIIGVGGIDTAQAALDKKTCGADLVQIYTGLIYQGPALIGQCVNAWPE